MKKILLSLCLLFVLSVTSEAQMHHPRHRHAPRRALAQPAPKAPERAYHPYGDFQFHVIGDLGMTDFEHVFRHDIPYHFSVGGMAEYQFGRWVSFGLGAEYYSSYGEECQTLRNMQETYIHTLPIYANLRLSLRDVPVFPFVEGRIGYSIPLGEVTCNDHNGVHHYMSTGLYTGGGVGLRIYRVNLSCGVSVIDVVDSDLGFNGGRTDIITDYYARLSLTF